ncbi:hypothetical protein PR048_003934 [Dryococelus australis]|uniref:Mutator-like transposase domain-containing protein n=1 Tax=Dryococelus australis TaxID=614101 RepID=A0ABQ9IPD7_9NEOP|nr:hypothetical protein PR048_003934 [Dryococelus australis]
MQLGGEASPMARRYELSPAGMCCKVQAVEFIRNSSYFWRHKLPFRVYSIGGRFNLRPCESEEGNMGTYFMFCQDCSRTSKSRTLCPDYVSSSGQSGGCTSRHLGVVSTEASPPEPTLTPFRPRIKHCGSIGRPDCLATWWWLYRTIAWGTLAKVKFVVKKGWDVGGGEGERTTGMTCFHLGQNKEWGKWRITEKTCQPVALSEYNSHMPKSEKKSDSPCVEVSASVDAQTDNEILSQTVTQKHNIYVFDSHQQKMQGRRIVDIHFFYISSLKELDSHNQMGCTLKDMDVVSEKRYREMDVNTAAVSGTISSGGRHAQLEEVFSAMDVPALSSKAFHKYHNIVCDAWEATAFEEMQTAALGVARLAKEKGEIDSDGILMIMVVADPNVPTEPTTLPCMEWYLLNSTYRHMIFSMHVLKKNYKWPRPDLGLKRAQDAPAAGLEELWDGPKAAIVGHRNGKVLYIGVKNKYCYTCRKATLEKKDPREHYCCKNCGREQSSTSMEAAVIKGFCKSQDMYGLKYTKLIADEDNSVYKKILDTRPYTNTTVEKIECTNHLLRNFCNKLKDIATTCDKTQNTVLIRKKSGITYFGLDLPRNEDTSFYMKVEELRKDILNCASHIFGEHKQGKERNYFCKSEKSENYVPALQKCNLFQKVQNVVRCMSNQSRSLIHKVNSNRVEHYNAAVAKFAGHTKEDVREQLFAPNTGMPLYKIHQFMYKKSPGIFVRTWSIEGNEECKQEKKKNSQYKKKLFSRTEADKDYGPNVERPDLDPETLNNCLTILQRESGEYREQRRNILTAFNFGRVCRMLPLTSSASTVKTMLYNHVECESLGYGRENKIRATAEIESKLNLKIHECVKKVFAFLRTFPHRFVLMRFGSFCRTPKGNHSQLFRSEDSFRLLRHAVSPLLPTPPQKPAVWKVVQCLKPPTYSNTFNCAPNPCSAGNYSQAAAPLPLQRTHHDDACFQAIRGEVLDAKTVTRHYLLGSKTVVNISLFCGGLACDLCPLSFTLFHVIFCDVSSSSSGVARWIHCFKLSEYPPRPRVAARAYTVLTSVLEQHKAEGYSVQCPGELRLSAFYTAVLIDEHKSSQACSAAAKEGHDKHYYPHHNEDVCWERVTYSHYHAVVFLQCSAAAKEGHDKHYYPHHNEDVCWERVTYSHYHAVVFLQCSAAAKEGHDKHYYPHHNEDVCWERVTYSHYHAVVFLQCSAAAKEGHDKHYYPHHNEDVCWERVTYSHYHAVVFLQCSAAAKEGHDKHYYPHHNEDDWRNKELPMHKTGQLGRDVCGCVGSLCMQAPGAVTREGSRPLTADRLARPLRRLGKNTGCISDVTYERLRYRISWGEGNSWLSSHTLEQCVHLVQWAAHKLHVKPLLISDVAHTALLTSPNPLKLSCLTRLSSAGAEKPRKGI